MKNHTKNKEKAVRGWLSLHRFFCLSVNCRFLEQVMGERKPPDLKAHFGQASLSDLLSGKYGLPA